MFVLVLILIYIIDINGYISSAKISYRNYKPINPVNSLTKLNVVDFSEILRLMEMSLTLKMLHVSSIKVCGQSGIPVNHQKD